jgi:hypothetical protein
LAIATVLVGIRGIYVKHGHKIHDKFLRSI